MMKKVLIVVLTIAMIFSLFISFSACGKKLDSIVVAVPDGAPALGMSYLMKEYPTEIDGVKVTYKIVDGTTGIRAAVSSGEADFAIMPTNMAATLYNGGLDIRVAGTNCYGLLYMISNQEGEFSLDSLKGQVLHTIGQGGTPEAVLKMILDANQIEYVESKEAVAGKVALRFYGDGKEIIASLPTGNIQYAILGEPAVSNAIQKVNTFSVVYDLQEGWMLATGTDTGYPQTSLIVKGSLAKSEEALVTTIAKLTLQGSNALKEDASPYVAFLKEKGVTVNANGVDRANIDPTFGGQAKKDISAYLTILNSFKPALIGGKMPDDNFYYNSTDLEVINAFGK